jgi:hypothetical protein
MPEPTRVIDRVQVGVETTPGTSVAANRRLQAFKLEPSPKFDVKEFVPMGTKFPIFGTLGKETTEAKISGDATYDEIVYILASAVSYSAPTQVNPPSGTAYSWTFEPSATGLDTVKTYTVEYGSSLFASKFTYGLVSEFGYKVEIKGRMEVDGTMIGYPLQEGITLTSNPTLIPAVPIIADHINVYVDNTSASLGTTLLTRLQSLEFKMSDRYETVWAINSSNTSYVGHVETLPKATLTLTMAADSTARNLRAALRNGDKKFIRIKAVGPVIEGSTSYLFQHDLCGILADGGGNDEEDGLDVIEWTFTVVYDSTWAKAMTIQVVNTRSGL